MGSLPAHDANLVDSLEAELEQARTALSALEEASANERLALVEAQLRAHPHLPQAPFLMAECLALQAQATRAADGEQAKLLEARRAALEGPRAVAFGETPSPAPAAGSALPVPFQLEGLVPNDVLQLDGIEGNAPSRLLPGLHHARVLRSGRPVFAAFFEVSAATPGIVVAVPQLAPCSADDLLRVRLQVSGLAPALATNVACGAWAIVREEPAGISVALCERGRCGAFLAWRKRPAQPFRPLSTPERSALPAWAGFTIAGAATLLTASIVLWQAGALDRSSKSAPTWQFGGLDNPQGLRF